MRMWKRLLYKLSRILRKGKLPCRIWHFIQRVLGYFFPDFSKRLTCIVADITYMKDVSNRKMGFGEVEDVLAEIDIKIQEETPLVSVVVPNYNHEKYLWKRLESIYNQTYTNYEVILLDDCSTDHSRSILQSFYEKYPEKTRIVFNESNSGGVFHQWRKGISLCRGKYIWIAESDDWCENNFLESLVPFMRHESVMIAYARTLFVEEDETICWNIEECLSDVNICVDRPFVMTGHQAVAKGFAERNIIPNVSSALIRNVGEVPREIVNLWSGMKLCGDWLFYVSCLRGGAIAYTNETINYYRQHGNNTSALVRNSRQFFEETFLVSSYIAQNYKTDIGMFEHVLDGLKKHYETLKIEGDVRDVEKWYRLDELKDIMKKRKPNILMCNYSMSIGGGEIFPIHLANELRRQGENVTFLDCNMYEYSENVRQKLDVSIPFVRLADPLSLRSLEYAFGIDIVHSHHGAVDHLISKYMMENEIKHIVTLHGMYEALEKDEANNLLKYVSKTCSRYIYIADKNLIPFKENHCFEPQKFVRIGNGLTFPQVHTLERESLHISKEDFVLCLVSRGIYEKGWVEACNIVIEANKKSRRKIHLVLVGSGEAYETVMDISRSHDCIHPVGEQKNPQDYFSMSDMGILPTRFEGESFPLTVIECMMCGRPVVATNIGEIPFQLEYDKAKGEMAGVMIDLNHGRIDERVWVEAIVEIVNNSQVYQTMKTVAQKNWKRFDITQVAKQYIEEYYRLQNE